MPQEDVVDLRSLLDGVRLGGFHVAIVALCFAALFVDGMDFASVLVAAPAILREWGLDRSAMGIVFGAGNLGLFVGAIAFGIVGDRYGRRVGLIAGVLTYTLPALATGFASGVPALLVLRFMTALGIGGVLPNAIALLTETAPRRYRATFVIIALIGTSLGAAAAGGVAAAVIPPLGWPWVFFTVGALGCLTCALLYFCLEESILFVAVSDPRSADLRRRLKALDPRLQLGSETRFAAEHARRHRVRLRVLFEGELRLVTPVMWAAYFAEGLTFMTLISWTPVLLESAGVSPPMASIAFGYGAAAGVVTRLLLSPVLDRLGAWAVLGSAVIALAAFVYLGSSSLSPATMIAAMVFAIAFATAAHDGLNAIVGGFYATQIRANGAGWANGAGRLAGIVGPIVAGYMLSAKLPFSTVISSVGAPYVLVVLLLIVLGRQSGARVGAEMREQPKPQRVEA